MAPQPSRACPGSKSRTHARTILLPDLTPHPPRKQIKGNVELGAVRFSRPTRAAYPGSKSRAHSSMRGRLPFPVSPHTHPGSRFSGALSKLEPVLAHPGSKPRVAWFPYHRRMTIIDLTKPTSTPLLRLSSTGSVVLLGE
jgi:hypothetical protein